MESATPEEIVRWAVATYFPKLTMATAFGPEGCVIIYFLSRIEPGGTAFDLDTGYQFKETLALRERNRPAVSNRSRNEAARHDRRAIRNAARRSDLQDQARPVLLRSQGDGVCDRPRSGFDAWMSGIRRDQSSDRAAAPIVGWDKKFGLVKISPLANWTKKDVWKLISQENIPYNPLHDQGYSEHRLLALHPRSTCSARTNGPADGVAPPRPSAACTPLE